MQWKHFFNMSIKGKETEGWKIQCAYANILLLSSAKCAGTFFTGCVPLHAVIAITVMIPFSCFPCGRSEWLGSGVFLQPACLPAWEFREKHISGHCHGWTPRLRPEDQQVKTWIPPRRISNRALRRPQLWSVALGALLGEPCEGGPANRTAWLLQASRLLAISAKMLRPTQTRQRRSLAARPFLLLRTLFKQWRVSLSQEMFCGKKINEVFSHFPHGTTSLIVKWNPLFPDG